MPRRAAAATAVAVAAVLLLSGCFGPDKSIAIDRAGDDFGVLVDLAAAVDVEVLHTLEVEEPVSKSCDTESDDEHTAFVAAGTVAVGATELQERDLLKAFEGAFDKERWTRVSRRELPNSRQAYVDTEGITATLTVEDGLLVIAVFSPCRS